MSSLRRWHLTHESPVALTLAADSRMGATDYIDDQIWTLDLGKPGASALLTHTRYGGRVGLASIIPMWWVENRPVYQFQAYASPPVVTAFAPGYIQCEAKITPQLALRAEYWAVDSHTLTARYTLRNARSTPVELKLDLVAFAAADDAEILPELAPRLNGAPGITFGRISNIQPLMVLQGGAPIRESKSVKLRAALTLRPGATLRVHWGHAGLPTLQQGFAAVDALFVTGVWTKALRKITALAADIPVIQTGDADTDSTLAFAYNGLIGAFLDPTMHLPYSSFVATRQPARGYSAAGDGTDYPRSWNGQTPPTAYITALASATIDRSLACGILRNYLALIRDDGFVDYKPGLGGQKSGMLCLPILARIAWALYQQTDELEFLKSVYPSLVRFVNRWLYPDLDADHDGLPEWTSEQQTGFPFMPTFAVGLGYGQNADIRLVEAPDLASYLLSELLHLRRIAERVGDDTMPTKLDAAIHMLTTRLEQLWNGERYVYRDRDTHRTDPAMTILSNGRGDEDHLPAVQLDYPARLVMHITGGIDLQPKMTLHVHGSDARGSAVHMSLKTETFAWSSGRGVHTTAVVFSRVDRIYAEGLSRVYRISVSTLDSTRRDISALLPIWSGALTPDRAADLLPQITDPAHFWLPNGIAMIDGRDDSFNSIKTGEGGGIWSYWVTLIGEGLLDHGYHNEAADLLRRVLRVQTAVLKGEKSFYEFYHTEIPRGLGEPGHIAGLIPLYLFQRVIGIFIPSASRVLTGGAFAWGQPITFSQHGVTVRRDASHTRVEFPGGQIVTLDSEAPFQTLLASPPLSTSSGSA